MRPLAPAVVVGFDDFLEELRADGGDTCFSMTLFDTELRQVHLATPLEHVPSLATTGCRPRGGSERRPGNGAPQRRWRASGSSTKPVRPRPIPRALGRSVVTIFSVYVIELDEAVCQRTTCKSRLSGKPHLYVGETSQTPEERLEEHLKGGFTSRPAVRNHGIRLRPRLYRSWGHTRHEKAARDAEAKLAEKLRARGFCVRGGR
jgi:hypothetical protein